MSDHDLVRAAGELIDAFNDADWVRFRTLENPDVVYQETGTGRRVESSDAHIALLEAWKRGIPDSRGQVLRSLAGGDTVALELTWTGTHSGPLEGAGPPIPATGRRIEVPATIWVTFRNGKAQSIHHHIDVMAMLMQLGVLPTPG
jgi:steroid delta-isomerase-like uncharacterized protein